MAGLMQKPIGEDVEKKEYVKRLNVAKCIYGSMEYQYLNLPKDHGIYYQDQEYPLMNANDHEGAKHVMQFGRCTSEENPKNVLSNALSQVSPVFALIDKAKKAMGSDGCKCKPRTLSSWQDTDDFNRLDGAPAILDCSQCQCIYGGVITITEMPEDDSQKQSNEEQSDQEKEEQAQEPKDILDTLPSSMADKIRDMNASHDMQSDSMDWYSDHADTFAQDYGCTPGISAQNYRANQSQVISASCLNEGGYIVNTAGLSNFNVAGSNAAAIGGGCAAAYNALMALDMPLPFADVIQGIEDCQSVPGFIDQGPMPVSMCGMRDCMQKLGCLTEVIFPKELTKESLALKEGEIAVLGTGKRKAQKETEVPGTGKRRIGAETEMLEAGRRKSRLEAAASEFCTLSKTAAGLQCAEFPHIPVENILKAKSNENFMVMKASGKGAR